MQENSRIYIAGHGGMVGSAIWRALQRGGYRNLVSRSSKDLNLTRQQEVENFFEAESPEYVVIAAARVGGISANNRYRAQFIYENLQIQSNLIHSAYKFGAKKLLFLGSSCIYPRLAPQPISEESLLTGPLEPTNEPYAIAKIAGIRMCDAYNRQYGTDFIAAMPTNLYGPGDNYHPENSHVLPALIRRFHDAKEQGLDKVVCWGSGEPLREFLFCDDLADACVFLLQNINQNDIAFEDQSGTRQAHINVGSGQEVSIRQLADFISHEVGYEGAIEWDTSKPDGTPRKLMDSTRLQKLGWTPATPLKEGITLAYRDYLKLN